MRLRGRVLHRRRGVQPMWGSNVQGEPRRRSQLQFVSRGGCHRKHGVHLIVGLHVPC